MSTSQGKRGRPTAKITATADEKHRLLSWASRESEPALAQRARIVLGCLEGRSNLEVARTEGVTNVTVGKWRRRFATQGLAGLQDAPRCGGPRIIDDDRVAEVVRLTLEASPPDAERWTTRSLGQRLGLSHATVGRIWRKHEIAPESLTHD
ncbi:helix-turn-helix domain-containing protein [Paraliomyxa miuraensis]|uniref:helix-turn-helix domain-containing protein n=1 Tax=Paraliomyxa miuraensis TaxID=376150 RepID=UPI00389991C0